MGCEALLVTLFAKSKTSDMAVFGLFVSTIIAQRCQRPKSQVLGMAPARNAINILLGGPAISAVLNCRDSVFESALHRTSGSCTHSPLERIFESAPHAEPKKKLVF